MVSRCYGTGSRVAQFSVSLDNRLSLIADLDAHPVLEDGNNVLNVKLCQQHTECGIRLRLGYMSTEQLVQRLAMAFGKTLPTHQRALVAKDAKDRYKQHPPPRKADAATHPTVRQCL